MLSVALLSHSNNNMIINNNINARFLFYFLLICVSVNIGFRDVSYIDTLSYSGAFLEMKGLSFSASLKYFEGEKLFNAITWLVAQLTDNARVFLFVIWFIFAIPFTKALNKIFIPWQATVVLFTYLNFPFFYNYTLNVLRQGIVIALLLYALALLLNGKKGKKFYISIALTPLFHWTGLPFAMLLLFAATVGLKLRTWLGIWVFLVIGFVTNINSMFIRPVWNLIPNIDIYTRSEVISNYSGGAVNRLDFLIFSAIWLIASILLYFYVFKDETYKKLIKIYVMFNCLFLLLGFVAFSDRIAVYSWFLIPLLIWYPVLKSRRYSPVLSIVIILVSFACGIITGVTDAYNPFTIFY